MWKESKQAQVARTIRQMEANPPRLVNSNPEDQKRELIRQALPKGATLAAYNGRKNAYFGSSLPMGSIPMGGGGNGSTITHMMRPYEPEVESQDRQNYPQDRRTANRYWRLFHKYDPLFGTAMDMYAEMIVSDFDLIVPSDTSKEIKDTLMYMCEQTSLIEKLRQMIKEYLVVGEAIPHCFFNEDLNIWDYVALHNPDYIEVQDSPLINMDPVMSFLPDDELRSLLTDGTPESMEFRRRLPPEFVSKVLASQKIPLSPLNCTFIPRKLHSYDVRGTSIASRLWRIFMVEDAVYASTIATYRRHASPIKVLKLGDAATGWIPAPGVEAKLLEMLSRAEMDPNAWLVWNYGVQFEAWGTTERAISISKEHAMIDEIKLMGLGLSKGFLSSETTFASAKSGLQVFLRRLLSLRQYFESMWLYPKFFRPIAEINGWHSSKPSELAHNYRIKRTAQELEEQRLLIMPQMRWSNKLDPSVDSELLGALTNLNKAFGFKISKGTLGAIANVDWRSESEASVREWKEENDQIDKTLGDTLGEKYKVQQGGGGAKPPGGPGAGDLPPGAAAKPSGAKPGSGSGSHPPGAAPGEGEKAPGANALKPEAPDQGGMGGTIE